MKLLTYYILGITALLNAPLAVAVSSNDMQDDGIQHLALRDDEKAFLDREHEKKYKDNTDGYGTGAETEEFSKIKKLEQCQITLKKIDKLSLEIEDLGQSNKHTQGISEDERRKLAKDKIKALSTQIRRYKTQAQEYCPAKYLYDSRHIKKPGSVKRSK